MWCADGRSDVKFLWSPCLKTLWNLHLDRLCCRGHVVVLGCLKRRSKLGVFALVAQRRTDAVERLC